MRRPDSSIREYICARSGVDIPENRYRLHAGRPDMDFVLAFGGRRDAITLGENAQRPSNGRSIHLMFLGEFTLRPSLI